MSKKYRLPQILRQRGFTVKESLDLIRGGNVFVNGAPAKNPNFQVNPNKETIEIKSEKDLAAIEKIKESFPKKYYILNKPLETITTTGTDNRRTVMDLFKVEANLKKTLFPVGRLDYETGGLLIVTNDGNFSHKLLNPKSKIEKEYHVLVRGKVSPTDIHELERGVTIEVKEQMYKTQPAKVHVIEERDTTTRCSITICEGKRRQVRLMFLQVGHRVLELKRVRIGQLSLGKLKTGEYRELTPDELKMLMGE